MAGIGFELQKMVQSDRLSTNLRAFLHATIIAAGPWLLTCVALGLMQSTGRSVINHNAMLRFNSVSLLAFSISLAVAGPFVLVMSRCLADAIYAKDVRRVPAMMIAGLARVFLWLGAIGAVLFFIVLQLPLVDRVLGFLLLMSCGGVWVVAGMMSALRSHTTVALGFAAGVTVAVVLSALSVGAWHEAGMLAGLLLGQAIIFFVLAARLFAEFPTARRRDESTRFDLGAAMSQYRGLAWAGFFYNAALWIDKWIMWMAPGAERADRGVWSHPDYESAMFFAFLTIVPVMAIFLLDVETRFHHVYQRFFRAIERRATLKSIRRNHGAILRITGSSFKRLTLVQATIAVIAILSSPAVMAWVGASPEAVAAFRFGVLGAAFHTLLIMCIAALAYFDQQRWLMIVTGTFLGVNAVLTLLSATVFGPAFFGWGYAVAAMVAFAVAFHAAARAITKLPYMTFVGANPSVREPIDAQSTPMPLAQARRPASVLAGGALNRTW
jgi:polysaccharide biosynthesis protein PelG